MFSYVLHFVRACQPCQVFARKQKLVALPLKPMVVQASFQQWELELIGEFKGNSCNGFKWIITATDYFTRWVEAIPVKF